MYGDCNACPPGAGGGFAGGRMGARGGLRSPAAMHQARRQAALQQAYALGGAQHGRMLHHGKQHLNSPLHPVHRNYVDYRAPRNLSYPEQNTPAATVQYPYYTLRGPTDFFYTGK